MTSKRETEGLREHQTSKEIEAQLKILTILSYDEDWHRYIDLQKKTRLSTKTLTKQLIKLEKLTLIRNDGKRRSPYAFPHPSAEIAKYPYPVYYRLNPLFVNAFRGFNLEPKTEKLETIKRTVLETKNPLEALNGINTQLNVTILGILLFIKEHKTIDEKIKRLLLEYLVWREYKTLTWKLINETERILDSIDIKNLVLEA